MARFLKASVCALALSGLAGCGPSYSPDTYAQRAVQQANKVDQGVIVGVRQINISADGTAGAATGGAVGGVVGGVSGAQGGASGITTAIGSIGGAVVGGLLGTATEHAMNDTVAFEYVVRNTRGELMSVTQKDETPLPAGQRVLLIAGAQARIVADYTTPVPTEQAGTTAPAPTPAPNNSSAPVATSGHAPLPPLDSPIRAQ